MRKAFRNSGVDGAGESEGGDRAKRGKASDKKKNKLTKDRQETEVGPCVKPAKKKTGWELFPRGW